MAGNYKRTKASQDVVGPKSLDLAYSDCAGAYKMLGPILGKLKYLGGLGAALYVQQGTLIAVYNTTGSAGFITMGDPLAIAAPTGPTNGIPCTPNAYTIFSMGSDTGIIGSAGTLYAYEILDESNYAPTSS